MELPVYNNCFGRYFGRAAAVHKSLRTLTKSLRAARRRSHRNKYPPGGFGQRKFVFGGSLVITRQAHSQGISSWLDSLVYAVAATFPTWAGLVVGFYGFIWYGVPARVLSHWLMRSPKP
jgi:hypothetical protein